MLVDRGADTATAVLTAQDTGVSTVLRGVDAATGGTLWTSTAWAPGAVGSRSTALVSVSGHLLVAVTTNRIDSDTTVLQVRDTATGRSIGPELPAPSTPAVLLDTDDGTAVVHEQDGQGGSSGVDGVDMATGKVLWTIDGTQATTAVAAGAGLVWVQAAVDGYTAVDDRTGTPRVRGLDQAPVLVLDGAQVVDDGAFLTPAALP